MSYIKTGAAHTNQLTEDLYGNEQTRYSRYETGFIEGEYRDMLALIADETGFDGFGFDVNAGSNDDSWHVVNLFENGGHYIDSVAIGGALDEEHALSLATTQFDYLGADYGVLVGYAEGMQFDHMTDDQAWSIDAISKLLNNPSQDKHYLPIITSKELQTEATRAAFDDVQWDNLTLSSHGGSLTNLYTDMIRADTFKELTQEFDLQQALIDLEAEEAEFDSIMDTVNRLPMLKDRLFRAMSQASNETLSVTNVTQTKPFKRGGVVNVAFVFDLSDGQKLSIWFHNPDSTPSKLLAGDMMVSWKWLLNKRDVTAILSPVNGQTVKIPTLARKMMLLASKNSKTFKRAQERKAKRDADINEAKSSIEQKKQTIEQLDSDIASLKDQIDAAMKANKGKADKDTTDPEDDIESGPSLELNSINISDLGIPPRYMKHLLDGIEKGSTHHSIDVIKKRLGDISELKEQLDEQNISYDSESEYQERINREEVSGFSVKQLRDDLDKYTTQLRQLANKQIRPSKIVGSGYKDNRAAAFNWLGEKIAELEDTLNRQPTGFYATVNISNYRSYLIDLRNEAKQSESDNAEDNSFKGFTALTEADYNFDFDIAQISRIKGKLNQFAQGKKGFIGVYEGSGAAMAAIDSADNGSWAFAFIIGQPVIAIFKDSEGNTHYAAAETPAKAYHNAMAKMNGASLMEVASSQDIKKDINESNIRSQVEREGYKVVSIEKAGKDFAIGKAYSDDENYPNLYGKKKIYDPYIVVFEEADGNQVISAWIKGQIADYQKLDEYDIDAVSSLKSFLIKRAEDLGLNNDGDLLSAKQDEDTETQDTSDLTPITRDTARVDDTVIWVNSNGRTEANFRGYINNDEVMLVVGMMQMAAPAKDVYFKEPPKQRGDIKVASNGMRWEDISTDNNTMLKIYMNKSNDDHWKVYYKSGIDIRVLAYNAQSKAGTRKTKTFASQTALFEQYPKFEAVFEDAGLKLLGSTTIEVKPNPDLLTPEQRKGFARSKVNEFVDNMSDTSFIGISDHYAYATEVEDREVGSWTVTLVDRPEQGQIDYQILYSTRDANGNKAFGEAWGTSIQEAYKAMIAKDDYYANPEDAPKAAAAETGKPNYNTTQDLANAKELTVSYINTSGKIGAKIVYYFNEDGSENGYKISGEWKAPSRGDNPTGSHAEMLNFEKFIKENRKVKSVSDRVKYYDVAGQLSQLAAKFTRLAAIDGWQLDGSSLSGDTRTLHRTIGEVDVMLEVTSEGYNAMTPDGDVLSYGDTSSLSDYEATNKMIEADVAAHAEETDEASYNPEKESANINKAGAKAAERFAEIASGNGWQLDIMSINDRVKKLFKRIDGVDLILEVHDQGYDVTTKDGEEVYFGSTNDLGDFEAANRMIEAAVKDMQGEATMQQTNTAYSQEDIDFLNTIIAGNFDPDNVDMDKMIEIGEKDENDPLYEQAINIVLEALDEASSNL